MPALKVTDENFEETIGNQDKPVLVKVGAEWCGPCKMVTPVLNELAETKQKQHEIYLSYRFRCLSNLDFLLWRISRSGSPRNRSILTRR